MTHQLEVRAALDDDLIDQLATLLIDAVDSGASVSFLPPLNHGAASRFWRELALGQRDASVIARDGERVDGVAVLAPSWPSHSTARAGTRAGSIWGHPSRIPPRA